MHSSGRSLSKSELRQTLRQRRASLSEPERAVAAAALADRVLEWLGNSESATGTAAGTDVSTAAPRTVAAYLSTPPEPGTAQLLPALRQAGYDVVVPVCEPQYQLSWAHWEPGIALAKSPRAPLWEPVGPRFHFTALGPLRCVLVPGLGMDTQGNRLGQGGGYYDRFLAQLGTEAPETPVLGYLYDGEILPAGAFAATVLDMPLHGAFTPAGLRLTTEPFHDDR